MLGEALMAAKQFFMLFNDVIYEVDSLIKTVDTYVKSFFVFNAVPSWDCGCMDIPSKEDLWDHHPLWYNDTQGPWTSWPYPVTLGDCGAELQTKGDCLSEFTVHETRGWKFLNMFTVLESKVWSSFNAFTRLCFRCYHVHCTSKWGLQLLVISVYFRQRLKFLICKYFLTWLNFRPWDEAFGMFIIFGGYYVHCSSK